MPTSLYPVTVGREYSVFGLVEFVAAHYYLIVDDLNLPGPYPANFFELTHSEIPPNWYFAEFLSRKDHPVKWRMGYKRLAEDDKHYEELVLHNDEHVRSFWDLSGARDSQSRPGAQ